MKNNSSLPTASLKDLGILPIHADPLEKEHVDGNVSEQELKIICQLVIYHKPNKIFEIGTFDGRTTINLAHFSSSESTIFTIDLPKEYLEKTKYSLYAGDKVVGPDSVYIDKEQSGTRYKKYEESKKIIQLFGDTGTFDFSPYTNQIDFIFIDGSHAKDYVKNDTEIAFNLLRENKGVILWHDYSWWKDVTDVINNYHIHDPRFKNCKHISGTTLAYLNLE